MSGVVSGDWTWSSNLVPGTTASNDQNVAQTVAVLCPGAVCCIRNALQHSPTSCPREVQFEPPLGITVECNQASVLGSSGLPCMYFVVIDLLLFLQLSLHGISFMGYPAWMFCRGAFPLTGAVLCGTYEGQVRHQLRTSVKCPGQ